MSELAFWGYGFAALCYAAFGLYVFKAWRGGAPGGALLGAVAASCGWAVANFVFASDAEGSVHLIAIVMLDAVRSGAWYAFVLILLRPLHTRRRQLMQAESALEHGRQADGRPRRDRARQREQCQPGAKKPRR